MIADKKLMKKLEEMTAIKIGEEEEQRLFDELAPLIESVEKIKGLAVDELMTSKHEILCRADEEGAEKPFEILSNAPTAKAGFFFLPKGAENEK